MKALFVAFGVAIAVLATGCGGALIGGWVGNALCTEPDDAILRCMGPTTGGLAVGFVAGIVSGCLLLLVLAGFMGRSRS